MTDQARNFWERIQDAERQILIDSLIESRGNVSEAASILQVPRTTVQSKLKKYNLRSEIRVRQIRGEQESLVKRLSELEAEIDSIKRTSLLLEAELDLIEKEDENGL